jgi:hypothetical protein
MAAAAGLAFINSIGNLAGFISPFAVGWIKDLTQSTDWHVSDCFAHLPGRHSRDCLRAARSMCALSFDRARIDRVDPNFPRTQLLRHDAGHRVDRAFRGGVDDRIRWIEIARHGADIDDAATLVAKELRRLLCRQQQALHVDVEMPVKVRFRDLLERQKIIDAGVVDQNVQPAERLLRLREDFFHIRSQFASWVLFKMPYVLAVREDHPLAHRQAVSLSDLHNEPARDVAAVTIKEIGIREIVAAATGEPRFISPGQAGAIPPLWRRRCCVRPSWTLPQGQRRSRHPEMKP